jgi:general secretion pathway protein J
MIKKKSAGFTLFEILIALVIFAILGIIVAVGLRRTLLANKRADEADQRIQKLEIAQALIRRDMNQIVDRPVSDKNGEKLPAVLLKSDEIDFTRGGIINPFNTSHRSDLQRIEYAYRDNSIVRTTWPTLDRVANSLSTSMTLLKNVTSFNVQVYDSKNVLQMGWPENYNNQSIHNNSDQQADLPKAVKITFSVKGQGVIEDIIPIPSRGLITSETQPDAKTPPKS